MLIFAADHWTKYVLVCIQKPSIVAITSPLGKFQIASLFPFKKHPVPLMPLFFTLALPWRTEDEHNLQGVPNHTRVECTLFFLKKGGIKVPQRPAIRHFMKILKWILGAANLLLRHLLRHLFALLFAHFDLLRHLLWYFSSTLKLPQKSCKKPWMHEKSHSYVFFGWVYSKSHLLTLWAARLRRPTILETRSHWCKSLLTIDQAKE